jgi:GNAT superfamily N-acetyltransferase
MQWQKGDYSISTDKSAIDVPVVHQYLCNDSYWASGIPLDIVTRSIDNSLCFGVYYQAKQVGFARVISDFATFAYLGDVFILPEHRGKGLSKWLMLVIMNYPERCSWVVHAIWV